MFENDVAGLDEDATLAAVEGNEHTAVEVEVTRLLLAAQWADLHPGDAVDPHGLPGVERAVQPGGEGTPEIADFAPAELGCSLKTSAGSAKRLIADALDLRYRLPMTWAAARAGQGPVYQARHIATTTRHLTLGQARQVDARIAPTLGSVSWGRLQDVVDGLVYEADPEGADAAAELAARERFVRLGRVTEHGMRLIIAKIAAGDGAWGEAMIARLAEILKRDGDFDGLDIRRSKALGILITQPAEALRLLNSHHNDDDDPAQSPEPDRCPEPVEGSKPDDRPDETTNGGPAVNADVALRQAQGASSDLALRQAQGAGTRSLRIGPPPFDPAKARPPAIVYVHVSEEALRAGTGVTRVEDIGPVLLTRLRQVLGTSCQIQLKPVINLNDQPAPVDSYEIPARIAEHLRLRQPADVFPYAAGGSRRTDLDHTTPLPVPQQGRPARSDRGWETRAARPLPPPSQNPRAVECPTTRTRHLGLADASRTHLLGQQQWYSRARQRRLRPTDLARRQSTTRRPIRREPTGRKPRRRDRARPNPGVHIEQLTRSRRRRIRC